MMEFQQSYTVAYPFHQAAQSVLQKYPNPHTDHVVSVDVVNAEMLPDGSLRMERLIGVRQHAPKWVQKLLGGSLDTYVREVSFVLPNAQEPELQQHSVNLTLRNYVRCRERIIYKPSPALPGVSTCFSQQALIEAQGKFAAGEIASYLGRKVEHNSWERFDANAQIGKAGFLWALERLWGSPKA